MKPYSPLPTAIILLTALLLVFPQLVNAQGNLVINGSFDVDASGWTTSNIGNNGGYVNAKGDPGGYFFLGSATHSSSIYPTISQTVTGLIAGDSYIVSGNYAFLDQGTLPTDASFGVAINSVFLFEAVAESGEIQWPNFSFLYTATSSSAVLSLSSEINNTDIQYGIDNISMEAVPEPSSSWLILFGSGVFLYARRNKNHFRI
jgi:hypothetical protein